MPQREGPEKAKYFAKLATLSHLRFLTVQSSVHSLLCRHFMTHGYTTIRVSQWGRHCSNGATLTSDTLTGGTVWGKYLHMSSLLLFIVLHYAFSGWVLSLFSGVVADNCFPPCSPATFSEAISPLVTMVHLLVEAVVAKQLCNSFKSGSSTSSNCASPR